MQTMVHAKDLVPRPDPLHRSVALARRSISGRETSTSHRSFAAARAALAEPLHLAKPEDYCGAEGMSSCQ